MNRFALTLLVFLLPASALAADPTPAARRVHVDIKNVAVDRELEAELARDGFVVVPFAKDADVRVTGKVSNKKPTTKTRDGITSVGVAIELTAQHGKTVLIETSEEARGTGKSAKLARPIAIAAASRALFPRFALLLSERLGFAAGVPYDANRPAVFDVQLGVATKKGMVTWDQVDAGQKKLKCTLKTMGYSDPRPVDGVIRRPPCEPDSPEDDRGAPE